ncbi:hypothetical protein FXN61_19965 [Lentzea sp. PSKA42]|uniref:DUF4878 domain-containing protein n=1 Tax=Lentzea indica TaxID=2604800 RepID=A0ABX1FJG2_9PSEU|nr:hypothetical protein [Lentzea indica]NKE58962.1 hypothetical protein [Lentzea indica]
MTRAVLGAQGALHPARFILASALVLTLGACSTGEQAGADDPRAAVDTYLAAMNNKDEATLRKMLSDAQRDQAAGHLSALGGKGLNVESLNVTQDFGPNFANAHVIGQYADKSRYDERIVLSKIDDRWYVGIPGTTAGVPSGKTTAAVPS